MLSLSYGASVYKNVEGFCRRFAFLDARERGIFSSDLLFWGSFGN